MIKMKRRGKKAQVTVFIIVGIIILLIVGSFFYLRSRTIEAQTESEDYTNNVPNWAMPIQSFVHNCIKDVGIMAFTKLGEHGGYIDFNDYSVVQKNFNINKDEPTDSDVVYLSGEDIPVAYWFYLQTNNLCTSCSVSSLIPNQTYIEEQVNRYMEREILNCLSGLETFSKQGINVVLGDTISTDTSINLNDVSFDVSYTVIANQGDLKTEFDKFKVNIDLDFTKIYDLARRIAEDQINEQHLEWITTHLLAIYSSTPDEGQIPPISWVDNEDTYSTWDFMEVKDKIEQSIISTYVPSIQIDSTKGARRFQINDPVGQGVYDTLYLEILNETYDDLSVSFFYNPEWNYFFDISPRTGEKIIPVSRRIEDDLGWFPVINTNYYHFYYDISYPVIVVIRDTKSLISEGEEGYTLMFALEVNLRDNKDLWLWNQGKGTVGTKDYSGNKISFDQTSTNQGDCTALNSSYNSRYKCAIDNQVYTNMQTCGENCQTQTTTTTTPNITKSLFCEVDQRLSGEITIRVYDQLTRQPIEGVNIDFGCGNHRQCPMESTDIDGYYRSSFPICVGSGYMLLRKDGYQSKLVPDFSVEVATTGRYNYDLVPIRNKEFEVYYINVTNMFRLKRMLFVDNETGISPDLYYEANNLGTIGITTIPDITLRGNGILKQLYDNVIGMSLSTSAENNLKAAIYQQATIVLDSNNIARKIVYWTDANRTGIVDLTNKALAASEFAWRLSNDASFVSTIAGANINSVVPLSDYYKNMLSGYITALTKEKENIQFLTDFEVNNVNIIKDHRLKASQLGAAQAATIIYDKVMDDIYEQTVPFSTVEFGSNLSQNISLVPGKYNVNVIFRDDAGFYIPASGIYTQDINMVPAMVGGAELTDSTGVWHVTAAELDSSSKIRFYIFKLDDPGVWDDTLEMSNLGLYSDRYRLFVEPEFLP